jgi:hypothetical protein
LRIARLFPLFIGLLLYCEAAVSQAASLSAYAVLPADTFAPEPASGQLADPPIERQPIQGFSALIKGEEDSYFILSDNGYGRRDKSSGYLLSIYHVYPDFRTATGGTGKIQVGEIIPLSDPRKLLPYPVVRKNDRLLTGADLDPESFRRMADGSYWIGEELNPSVLRFSAKGELLAAPFRLDGLSAEDNPLGEEATLPRSRGFEGMAVPPGGRWLYPMLEGALTGSDSGLNIYVFDVHNQRFLNRHASKPAFRYHLDEAATAIGDFTMFSETGGLVIERDSAEGEKAVVKKVYKVNFKEIDEDGFLLKELVADLLDISDPHDLNRDGDRKFSFSFWTIEGLVVVDRTTLGIVNDNNYPIDRTPGAHAEKTDDNEFIMIRVDPIWD